MVVHQIEQRILPQYGEGVPDKAPPGVPQPPAGDLADKSTGRSGDNATNILDTDHGSRQPLLDGRGCPDGGGHKLRGLEFEGVLRGGDGYGGGRLPTFESDCG